MIIMDLEKYYDKYWQEKGEDIDHRRLDMIVKYIEPDRNVLEINCGASILAQKVLMKGGIITVTDLSNIALERAKKKGIQKTFKVDIDTQQLPFGDSQFDVIVSNSMIEHSFFPENTIKEGVRVLKRGGLFIVMVPNIGHWRFRLWLLFGRFPYLENTPTDTLHLRFFTSNSINKLGEKYGLRVKDTKGSSGTWVESIYPIFFRITPIRQLYDVVTNIYPSLFARYLLVVFEKQ